MNPRSTFWYFACLLSLLWGFGLIVSKARTRVDDVVLLPSLKVARNVVWDAIIVERQEKDGKRETFRFAQNNDYWYLGENNQSIKVVADVIRKQMLQPLQNLRNDALVAVTNDLAAAGLEKPRAVVTLKGRPEVGGKTGAEREWKVFVGKESVDERYVFVNTSDRPDRAYAVAKRDVDGFFFRSINDLRSKRLFDFQDTDVLAINLKQGTTEVQLKRTESTPWVFEKPPFGLAEYEGIGATAGGVKGLLSNIVHTRVDSDADFLPPDPTNIEKYGLTENTASLRIQTTTKLRGDALDVETLLLGKQDGDFYYGRMASDDGVFKVHKKYLEPILQVLSRPGELRSRVVLPAEAREAKRIVMSRGKDETTLRLDDKIWRVTMTGRSEKPANPDIVKKLLETIDGRPEIERFIENPAITDASLGLDNPREIIGFFADAKPAKGEEIKDRPIVVLAIGKEEKGSVYCRRTMQSGDVSRFAVPVAIAQRILNNTFVPLLDPALPEINLAQLTRIDADLSGRKLDFQRKDNVWTMTDPSDPTPQPADEESINRFLAGKFGHLVVRRWVRQIEPKEDLAPYGLAKPDTEIRLTIKKEVKEKKDDAKDGIETIDIKLGKEMDVAGDGVVVYGTDSRQPGLLFVASADLVKPLRTALFEDRGFLLRTQPEATVALLGLPGTPYPWASPLATGTVTRVDPDSIKELKLTVRGPFETRQLHFVRQDKTWLDKTGLQGFQLDPVKIDTALKLITSPEVIAFVGMEGANRKLFKLRPDEAVLTLQATLADGKPLSLTVGAKLEKTRFAVSSSWPEAIFVVPQIRVDPLLQGPAYFSKPTAQ